MESSFQGLGLRTARTGRDHAAGVVLRTERSGRIVNGAVEAVWGKGMLCGSWDFGSGLGPRRSRSSPNCFSAVYVVFYFVYFLTITLEFQFLTIMRS